MADQRTQSGPRRRTFGSQAQQSQYDHEVVDISRVVRVVKGGRRFRFRATVVVGDRNGTVGFGTGKSRDIQHAIQKAQEQASKNVITIPLKDGTISRPMMSRYKGAVIFLKPANSGTGVIAGSTVRTVADLAGIKDLVAKRYGSANRLSNVRATIKGLSSLSLLVGHQRKR